MSYELSGAIFLIAILASRIISTRAMKGLSSEHKVSLIDAFSGVRAYGLIPIVVIIAGYYFLLDSAVLSPRVLYIGYISVFVVYLTLYFFYGRKKLAALGLPDAYLKQYGRARAIQYLGVGILLASLLTDVV